MEFFPVKAISFTNKIYFGTYEVNLLQQPLSGYNERTGRMLLWLNNDI